MMREGALVSIHSPLHAGRLPSRPLWSGALASYLAVFAFAPWLPSPIIAVAAAVVAALLASVWHLAGRQFDLIVVTAAWMPLHLLLVATGGVGSPLIPSIVGWFGLVAFLTDTRRTLALSVAAGLLLLGGEAWTGALGAHETATVVVMLAIGYGLARLIDPARRALDDRQRTLSAIVAEAARHGGASEKDAAAKRLQELDRVLSSLTRRSGAVRAILWELDPRAERGIARRDSAGTPPDPIRLAGDPIRWAADEGMPLRVSEPPRWAPDSRAVCLIPAQIGAETLVLSLVFGEDASVPDEDRLNLETVALWSLLRAHAREAEAVAGRERVREVLEILRRLPEDLEVDAFAQQLAAAALRLAGATGATVAVWEDEVGTILAVAGEDGGPLPGQWFRAADSELALAARGGRIIRERRRQTGGSLPIATGQETWFHEPRAFAAFSLDEPEGRRVGVLGVWSSRNGRFDAEALAAVEILARYAALLLQHARTYSDLRRTARSDPLTGLYNRGAFDERLLMERNHFHRYKRPVCLIMLDLDRFKRLNDSYGHAAGDAVLKAVGEITADTVREVDFAARFGGEEFVILLPETDLDHAAAVAARLRRRLEQKPIDWNGQQLRVEASFGVAACPACVTDPDELVAAADAALYRAKAEGRNRVVLAPLAG